MQNIEIKAKYQNLERAKSIAKKIGAKFEATYRQVDTYFVVKRGRLKLREIASHESRLIYYNRPDERGPKTSDYQICPVANAGQLKEMLQHSLGVWKTIEKQRDVYWFDEVRIHLDAVNVLGNFIEFEGVISEGAKRQEVADKVKELMSRFEIHEKALIEGSYSDLTTQKFD